MREILFRGKRTDNGNWVQGVPWEALNGSGWYLFQVAEIAGAERMIHVKVDSATIGQYTGLADQNGKKIFEGDIIKIPDNYDEYGHNAGEIYEIYFCCGGFRLKPKYTQARGYWLEDDRTAEVIGNIHDNPKLYISEDIKR